MQYLEYRTHEDGPITSIHVEKGRVIIAMDFDVPGCHTRLHSHTFDHWMECTAGSARITIDGVVSVVKDGDRYLVAAHKQHDIYPLELDTVLRCIHEHDDIEVGKHDGIPLEWLHRLTDEAIA